MLPVKSGQGGDSELFFLWHCAYEWSQIRTFNLSQIYSLLLWVRKQESEKKREHQDKISKNIYCPFARSLDHRISEALPLSLFLWWCDRHSLAYTLEMFNNFLSKMPYSSKWSSFNSLTFFHHILGHRRLGKIELLGKLFLFTSTPIFLVNKLM